MIYVLPTRWGGGFAILVLLLFLSGVNYQNSMMLALAFLSLAILLTHVLWTYRNLAGLHVAFREAGSGFAGGTGTVVLRVSARAREHMAVELGWPDIGWQSVSLRPGETRDVAIVCSLRQRGRFAPGRMLVTTTLPFGLIRAWSWQNLDVPLWVWPKPVEGPFPAGASAAGEGGENAPPSRMSGDELSDLRDWQPGEAVTRVSWKHVAAHDQWLVKDLDASPLSDQWLDFAALSGSPELRLSVLAWWTEQLSQQGLPFGLRLGSETILPGTGDAHRRRVLDVLAGWGAA